jgi:hypothetical protein
VGVRATLICLNLGYDVLAERELIGSICFDCAWRRGWEGFAAWGAGKLGLSICLLTFGVELYLVSVVCGVCVPPPWPLLGVLVRVRYDCGCAYPGYGVCGVGSISVLFGVLMCVEFPVGGLFAPLWCDTDSDHTVLLNARPQTSGSVRRSPTSVSSL